MPVRTNLYSNAGSRESRIDPRRHTARRRFKCGEDKSVPEAVLTPAKSRELLQPFHPTKRDAQDVRGPRRTSANFYEGLDTERVGFEPTEGCPSNDFESFAFDHSATSPNRAEPCRRRLGPRGCGACSRAGSAQSNSAPHPTRPSTSCATERGGRTGRRFWWAGLRDVASTASR